MHLVEPFPSLFGVAGAKVGQHGLGVLIQHHADELIQPVFGTDVQFRRALEQVA